MSFYIDEALVVIGCRWRSSNSRRWAVTKNSLVPPRPSTQLMFGTPEEEEGITFTELLHDSTGSSLMNNFCVRYQDRSYVVWLREIMGAGAERRSEEWVILSGDKMVAAIPYIESESLEQVEARVLSVLSTRIK